jgi:hypothetical protein
MGVWIYGPNNTNNHINFIIVLHRCLLRHKVNTTWLTLADTDKQQARAGNKASYSVKRRATKAGIHKGNTQ